KHRRHVTAAHAVVVLAAGGSTRLGQSKQLLTRQGETLVHRVVRLALELVPAQVLVVVGGNAQAVTSSISGLDATPVTNHHWESGLASSLQVA
ncbi:nucleotidyltransferase family protein, partial [Eoetvoesiella caeni]|uniref:nucleotidyltransferase family protein n=1 Tax=Eoetvoesiella caeni TaxID=645616 RepID=UPI001F571605